MSSYLPAIDPAEFDKPKAIEYFSVQAEKYLKHGHKDSIQSSIEQRATKDPKRFAAKDSLFESTHCDNGAVHSSMQHQTKTGAEGEREVTTGWQFAT